MNTFILMVVLAIGSTSSSSQHPLTGFSTEFATKTSCEQALKSVRQQVNKAYVVLLTCEAK